GPLMEVRREWIADDHIGPAFRSLDEPLRTARRAAERGWIDAAGQNAVEVWRTRVAAVEHAAGPPPEAAEEPQVPPVHERRSTAEHERVVPGTRPEQEADAYDGGDQSATGPEPASECQRPPSPTLRAC